LSSNDFPSRSSVCNNNTKAKTLSSATTAAISEVIVFKNFVVDVDGPDVFAEAIQDAADM
jgi:hypothetical protein